MISTEYVPCSDPNPMHAGNCSYVGNIFPAEVFGSYIATVFWRGMILGASLVGVVWFLKGSSTKGDAVTLRSSHS